MSNAIFFIVIITFLYYQNEGIDNRTQLKSGKKTLELSQEKSNIDPPSTQSLQCLPTSLAFHKNRICIMSQRHRSLDQEIKTNSEVKGFSERKSPQSCSF